MLLTLLVSTSSNSHCGHEALNLSDDRITASAMKNTSGAVQIKRVGPEKGDSSYNV
jgi:hypothetical protein